MSESVRNYLLIGAAVVALLAILVPRCDEDADVKVSIRSYLLIGVVLALLAGGVKALDVYGDWRWTERCVKHHADFCNNDGDGDAGKPWWAHRDDD